MTRVANRKPPLDHKRVEAELPPRFGRTLDDFLHELSEITKDWVEPHFPDDGWYSDSIAGFVPMTPEEASAAAKRRERTNAAREAKAAKKTANDEEKLRRLADKLGMVVTSSTPPEATY